MSVEREQINEFRNMLSGQELAIFNTLASIFDGAPPGLYPKGRLFGLVEAYLALFQYFYSVPLRGMHNINWQFSTAQIVSEISDRMQQRSNLQYGQRFYDGQGILHHLCLCGAIFKVEKNTNQCPACQEKRRRDGMVKSIERFIEKRKLIGGKK